MTAGTYFNKNEGWRRDPAREGGDRKEAWGEGSWQEGSMARRSMARTLKEMKLTGEQRGRGEFTKVTQYKTMVVVC